MGLLSPPHLILLMAIALIVFGPKKLPEIGRTLGQALREFNKVRDDFMNTVHSEMDKVEHTVSADTGSSYSSSHSSTAELPPPGTASRALEYPAPPPVESADALPYGADFHATERDSQPTFRTAQPEHKPANTVAYASTPHPTSSGHPMGSATSGASEGKA